MLVIEVAQDEWFGFGEHISCKVVAVTKPSRGKPKVRIEIVAPRSVPVYLQRRDHKRRWPIPLGREPANGTTRPQFTPHPRGAR